MVVRQTMVLVTGEGGREGESIKGWTIVMIIIEIIHSEFRKKWLKISTYLSHILVENHSFHYLFIIFTIYDSAGSVKLEFISGRHPPPISLQAESYFRSNVKTRKSLSIRFFQLWRNISLINHRLSWLIISDQLPHSVHHWCPLGVLV